MNKKSAARSAAVIEIGSNNVRMLVSQLSKGKLTVLDRLEYPTDLGHDVFEDGTISFESLRELSGVLDRFSSALLSYGIERPRVISCSAMREAKNRFFVADQLKVRNGVNVSVLEESEEKACLFSEIVKKLGDEPSLKNSYSLIAFVGSGSIGLAVYDGQKVVYSQNVPVGAVKLYDLMSHLRRETDDFHYIVDDYLNTVWSRIRITEFRIQNLVLTGSGINTIARICGGKGTPGVERISVKKLSELYLDIRSMTPDGVGRRFGLSEDQAVVLYSSLAIYRGLLRFCKDAREIIAPDVDISEAVARNLLEPRREAELSVFLRESALACAELTARHFGCDLAHSGRVGAFACRIFDKLKKVHGLPQSDRLTLELAAALHSCGGFVSVRQHNKCTYDLIKGMDLFGLHHKAVARVAFAAGSISDDLSTEDNPEYAMLSPEEKLSLSKLAAIFGIANALDKSHQGRLSDLRISLEEDRVLFRIDSAGGDSLLERWAFEDCSAFFKEVFGLSPELIVKQKMI